MDARTTRETHFADWVEFSSGLSLLYLGIEGPRDEYTDRIIAAQRHGNLDELTHVTALMLVNTPVPMGVRERWSELDRLYHARFCECVAREGGGE